MTKAMGCGVAAIIALLVALALYAGVMGKYNKLVDLDEGVAAGWAQVETVLQRRYDLIPNLVNTVKGYAAHEKDVFTEVTRLRSQWGAAKTIDAKAAAASGMESVIGRLLLVAERYPELKANQNFLALQTELAGTENRISVERHRYNEAVRAYNSGVRRFPNNIIAGMFNFAGKHNYFEAADEAQAAPVVQF